MKRLSAMLVAVLCISSLHAQYYDSFVYWYDSDSAPLVECANGRVVKVERNVPFYVDSQLRFISERAIAECTGLYGLVAPDSTAVTPFVYNEITRTDIGLFSVRKSDNWGMIDRNGNETVPCKYKSRLRPIPYTTHAIAQDAETGMFGIIDIYTGKCFGGFVYDDMHQTTVNCNEGLIKVKKEGLYGVTDTDGNQVIDCLYDYIYSFENGCFAVSLNDKYGYVSRDGEMLVECRYDFAFPMQPTLHSVVRADDRKGIISITGEIAWLNAGDEVYPYGYPLHFKTGGKKSRFDMIINRTHGYVDTLGNVVIPAVYNEAKPFLDGYAEVNRGYREGRPRLRHSAHAKRAGRWGVIDSLGHEVIPCRYKYARNLGEGIIAVSKDGLLGQKTLIDAATGSNLGAKKYSEIEPFSCHRAITLSNIDDDDILAGVLYGVIDNCGREIVAPRYRQISRYRESMAAFWDGEHCGFINSNGNVVVEPRYDSVSDFGNGYAQVESAGNFGLIDSSGNEVIPCRYDYRQYFALWKKLTTE